MVWDALCRSWMKVGRIDGEPSLFAGIRTQAYVIALMFFKVEEGFATFLFLLIMATVWSFWLYLATKTTILNIEIVIGGGGWVQCSE